MAHWKEVSQIMEGGGKPKCVDCDKQLSNYGIKRCKPCGQVKRWDIIGRVLRPRYYHYCKSKRYKEWRMAVFTRDNFTCQICKIKKSYIEADHIKSWTHFPELRYKINNGRTLCLDCHKLTPNYKGRAIRKYANTKKNMDRLDSRDSVARKI